MGKDTKTVPIHGCSFKIPKRKQKQKQKYNSELTLGDMAYILCVYGMETDSDHIAYFNVEPSRLRQLFHEWNPTFKERFTSVKVTVFGSQ